MAASTTRERLLDAAERLFAEHGFDATSTRAITSGAGTNLASVNYHFGSKEALLSAVLARRLSPINEERLAILTDLENSQEDVQGDLGSILRAFILPPFRTTRTWGTAGQAFLKLAGRMHSEPSAAGRGIFLSQFAEVFSRFTAALTRALPRVPPDELHWRLHFIIGAMAHTLIWQHGPCADAARHAALDPETITESLVQFSLAGLRGTARGEAQE